MADTPNLLQANIGGLKIVEKPEILGKAWFLKDAEGLILRSGIIGMGEVRTPGADQNTAATIECGSDLYAAIQARAPVATRA